MVTRTSIKQYQSNSVSNVHDADPHTLIAIIYQHILGSIAAAKGAIQRKDIETKGKQINKAVALIGELLDALDMKVGGDLAVNLAGLYEYSVRKLIDAHIQNDSALLDEITAIFLDIKEGWDAIPTEKRIKMNINTASAGA